VRVRGLAKTFVLHNRDGAELPVFAGLDMEVAAGECVVLAGPSGCGKSSLMRCLYGNYAPSAGTVELRHGADWLDLSVASPRAVIDARRRSIGYVSQFLRVIPRVPTLDLVAEPLRRLGLARALADEQARELLDRLALPERLWHLPPATFSGGEQQRVNVARGLIAPRPVLLLDEPTASADIQAIDQIERAIREYAEQTRCTVIFSTHMPSQAMRLSTRVLALDGGNIGELGETRQVLQSPQAESTKAFLKNWKL